MQEALAIRGAIGLLRALDDRGRQMPAERLAQNVFLAQSLDLERRRERGAELDHAMVEERKAALHRMRHGDAVTLRGEDVAGQQAPGFEVLGARERVPRGKLRRQGRAQLLERVDPSPPEHVIPRLEHVRAELREVVAKQLSTALHEAPGD